ncbi:MAG: hypothetical protein U0791_26470 [Gemmataceae bacterium]
MPDLDADTIAEAAQGPASTSQDGRSAAAVPIPDQIEAAKFKAANVSGGGSWGSVGKAKAIPPGPQE